MQPTLDFLEMLEILAQDPPPEEASSINFRRSVTYGFGVLATTLQFALHRIGLVHLPRFSDKGRKSPQAGPDAYYARPAETIRSL